jgi:hypothetical protein
MYNCTVITKFINNCTLLHLRQECMMEQEKETGMKDGSKHIDCDNYRYADEGVALSKPCVVI